MGAGSIVIYCAIIVAMLALIAKILVKPKSYNSVSLQSMHYFLRPHVNPHKFAKIHSQAAWMGHEMMKNQSLWLEILTDNDIKSIKSAMTHFYSMNKSSMHELTSVDDFPLSNQLRNKINKWKHEVGIHGRGVQVIRGIPVQDWTQHESELFFWALGRYLGTPGAQDNDGELLGHVTDVGGNSQTERQYRSNAKIDFHCDAADVVGLLCLRPAKEGGASRIVSSLAVFNMLLDHPKGDQYIQRLTELLVMDVRGTGPLEFVMIPPIQIDKNGNVRTFYHMEYFRSGYRYKNAPPLSDELKEALDAYDSILLNHPELYLDMELQPGDIQLISNHVVLHSRTSYVDHEELDKGGIC